MPISGGNTYREQGVSFQKNHTAFLAAEKLGILNLSAVYNFLELKVDIPKPLTTRSEIATNLVRNTLTMLIDLYPETI